VKVIDVYGGNFERTMPDAVFAVEKGRRGNDRVRREKQ
jgi:hypothetical protein